MNDQTEVNDESRAEGQSLLNNGLADFLIGDMKCKFAQTVKAQELVILEWIVTGEVVVIGTLKMSQKKTRDIQHLTLKNSITTNGQMLNVVCAANVQHALNPCLLT